MINQTNETMTSYKENPAKEIPTYGNITMSLLDIIEFFNHRNNKTGKIVSIEILNAETFNANDFFSNYTEIR